jgi:hypothetical protein
MYAQVAGAFGNDAARAFRERWSGWRRRRQASARRAGRLPVPTYAIDDETAVKVIDGTVEVVSEGYWKLFNP